MLDSETIVKSLKYYEATIENAFVKCALRKAITLIEQQELAINNLKTEIENRVKKIEDQPKIVRCKDCILRGNPKKCFLAKVVEKSNYDVFMLDMRGEWFCADGRPKDGNT